MTKFSKKLLAALLATASVLNLSLSASAFNSNKTNSIFIESQGVSSGATAYAETNREVTYVDELEGIQFRTINGLINFVDECQDKGSVSNVSREVSEWVLNSNGVFLLSSFENISSDISSILITPTYVDVVYEISGIRYELYNYYDTKAGKSKIDYAKNLLEKKLYSAKENKASSGSIYSYQSPYFSDYESYYCWETGGEFFVLRINTSESDDYLSLCEAKKYLFTSQADEVKRGWVTIGSSQYYYDADGNPVTGMKTIDGIKYRFDKNGVCLGKYSGWTKNSKGDRYYYKNGIKLKSCWLKVNGKKTYYLLKSGKMAVGAVTIGGKTYTFGNNGKIVN